MDHNHTEFMLKHVGVPEHELQVGQPRKLKAKEFIALDWARYFAWIKDHVANFVGCLLAAPRFGAGVFGSIEASFQQVALPRAPIGLQ